MTKKRAAPVRRASASKRQVSAKAKPRMMGVRVALTTSLKKAPSTRAKLLGAIGCSVAALDNHLKQLQAEGAILVTGKHPKVFSLVAPNSYAIAALRSPSVGDEAGLGPELRRALRYVQQRMRGSMQRPERTAVKIATLERLADAMPAPVAAMLRDISLDYRSVD
jgi:hypothetical protein